MFKKIFILTLTIFALLCGLVLPKGETVFAEQKKDIVYVAFGDSIAEAYAINMKTKTDAEQLITGADNSYDLIADSYVDLIRDKLNETYNTTAYNFSYSGDKCEDLVSFIEEFYNANTNEANNPNATNDTFNDATTGLTNQEIYNIVKNANVITICIGANNVLASAPQLITDFLMASDITSATTAMEGELKKLLLGNGDGASGLVYHFPKVLDVIYKINPKANVYFTNVYNPFRVLNSKDEVYNASLFGYSITSIMPNFNVDGIAKICELSELAIDGGTDSSRQQFKGINDIIEEKLNEFKVDKQNCKFTLIDSKSKFDSISPTGNAGEEPYLDYVNPRTYDITLSIVQNLLPALFSQGESALYGLINDYFDPHPTYSGHELIFNAHNEVGIEPYIEHTVQFETNCDQTLDSVVVADGEVVEMPTIIRDGFNLVGWYTTSTFENGSEWNFETNIVEQNITLYAKWEEIIAKVNVTLNFNGGQLNNMSSMQIEIDAGTVFQQPTDLPDYEKYQFVKWSTNAEGTDEYDFTQTVIENITLYAIWEKVIFEVRFEYAGGKVGQNTYSVVEVNKNGVVQEPFGDNLPILDKHILLGWKEQGETSFFVFTSPIVRDITLEAVWKQNIFDITFNFNGGTHDNANAKNITGELDKKIIKPDFEPTKEDYKFIGWYKEQNCENVWNFEQDVIKGDITLYAGYERTVWYVTVDYNGGKLNSENSRIEKIIKGEALIGLSADNIIKDDGFFEYWYLEGDIEQSKLNFPLNVSADIRICAKWIDAITVNINDADMGNRKIPKGTTIENLRSWLTFPNNKAFYGWYQDSGYTQEFDNNTVLTDGKLIFVKWSTVRCENEDNLKQSLSPPTAKNVIRWKVEARIGSKIRWKYIFGGNTLSTVLDDEIEVKSESDLIKTWWPQKVGEYSFSCIIDGVEVVAPKEQTVEISYSIPKSFSVRINKVANKKTYTLEIENNKYYNPDNFVWYRTTNSFSNEFLIKIGEGAEINYTFESDCKICAKYLTNKDSTDGVMSNVIEIRVNNLADNTITITIGISVAIVVLMVTATILSKRKYKGSF